MTHSEWLQKLGERCDDPIDPMPGSHEVKKLLFYIDDLEKKLVIAEEHLRMVMTLVVPRELPLLAQKLTQKGDPMAKKPAKKKTKK